ncbi:hypothetical protein HN261_22015, partial [Acinetobacter baumannii]|nr:hypothetical protein [Acinetobacter baumannii]
RKDGVQQLWRGAGGQARPVLAPELAGRDITAMSFSPDGVRLALVERTRSGSRLLVARVSRGDNVEGEGVRVLSTTQADTPQLRRLNDVGWLDATHLLVLGSATDKEAAGPYAVSQDASSITNQGEALAWDP